jgi:PD-(D/E)XK nuclease superfamily
MRSSRIYPLSTIDSVAPARAVAEHIFSECHSPRENLQTDDGTSDLGEVVCVTTSERISRDILEALTRIAHERRWSFTPPTIGTFSAIAEFCVRRHNPHIASRALCLSVLSDILLCGEFSSLSVPIQNRATTLATISSEKSKFTHSLRLANDLLDFDDIITHYGVSYATYISVLESEGSGSAFFERVHLFVKALSMYHEALEVVGISSLNRALSKYLEENPSPYFKRAFLIETSTVPRLLSDVVRNSSLQSIQWSLFVDDTSAVPYHHPINHLPAADQNLHLTDSFHTLVNKCASLIIESINQGERPAFVCTEPTWREALTFHLAQEGIKTRQSTSRPFRITALYQFISLIKKCESTRSSCDMRALLRHPLLRIVRGDTLVTPSLVDSDTHHDRCLENHFEMSRSPEIQDFVSTLHTLSAPLHGERLSPSNWKKPLGLFINSLATYCHDVLQACSPSHTESADSLLGRLTREILEGFILLERSLDSLQDVSSSATLSGLDALELLLTSTADLSVPVHDESTDEIYQVECIPWIDSPFLGDRPLIVVGVHESCLPEKPLPHPLLPESVRKKLGVPHHELFTARDKAILSILQSRDRSPHYFYSRTTHDGNFLLLSRLFFEGIEDYEITARIVDAYRDSPISRRGEDKSQRQASSLSATPDTMLLEDIEKLCLTRSLTSVSVSDVKAYLDCPFRFFLSRVLQITTLNDTACEISASHFGELVHQTLASLTRDIWNLPYLSLVDFLIDTFDTKFARQFSSSPSKVLAIQRARAHSRLKAYANWHMLHVKDGWQLLWNECALATPLAPLLLPLKGRIDRVVFNEKNSHACIIDFKVSETDLTFKKKNCPLTLQLSGYGLLLLEQQGEYRIFRECVTRSVGLVPLGIGSVDLKVPSVPFDETSTYFHTIFTEAIRDIHRGKFWPPSDVTSIFSDFSLMGHLDSLPLLREAFARCLERETHFTGKALTEVSV